MATGVNPRLNTGIGTTGGMISQQGAGGAGVDLGLMAQQGMPHSFFSETVAGPITEQTRRSLSRPMFARPSMARVTGRSLLSPNRKSLLAGLGLLVSTSAFAGRPIPEFHPDQHVYCISSCGFDERNVERALDEAKYPFYVVVYKSVGGPVGNDRRLLQNKEELLQAWVQQGFDTDYNTWIGITMQERTMHTWAGDAWQSEGFKHPLPKRYQDKNLIPHFKRGDFAKGITNHVEKIEGLYDQYTEHKLETLRQTIREAEQILTSPYLLQNDNVSSLRTELKEAQRTEKNGVYEDVVKAQAELEKEVKKLQPKILERKTIQQRFDLVVVEAKKAQAHPEISVSESRKISESLQLADRSSSYAEKQEMAGRLRSYLSQLDSDLSARSHLRSQVKEHIIQVESYLNSHDEFLEPDQKEILKQKLSQLLQIQDSINYSLMESRLASLQDSYQTYRKITSDRKETKQSLQTYIERAEILLNRHFASLTAEDAAELTFQIKYNKKLLETKDYEEMKTSLATLEAKFASAEAYSREVESLWSEIATFRQEITDQLKNNEELLQNDNTKTYEDVLSETSSPLNSKNLQKLRDGKNQLEQSNSELKDLIYKRQSEERAQFVATISALLALLGGLSAASIWGVVRRNTRRGLREQFNEEMQSWKEKLTNAKSRYMDFETEKDKLIGLENKAGQTKELYEKAATLMDEIIVGLNAFESHLNRLQEKSRQGGFFNLKPLQQALEELNSRFVFDTGKMDKKKLFYPDRTIQIEMSPEEFEDHMSQKFAEFDALWTEIQTSYDAILSQAEKDFSNQNILEMRHDLMGVGLSSELIKEWLKSHSLYENPEATWEQLDQIRRKDPVAYVRTIRENKQAEESLKENVRELTGYIEVVNQIRQQALSLPVNYSATVIRDEKRDPRLAEREALAKVAELKTLLYTERDMSVIREKTDVVVSAFQEVLFRKNYLLETIATVEGNLTELKSQAQNVRDQEQKNRVSEFESLQNVFSDELLKIARSELQEAGEDLQNMRLAISKAEDALKENDHLSAQAFVEITKNSLDQAMKDFIEFDQEVKRLQKLKDDTIELYQDLSATRAVLLRKMQEYGQYANPELFRKGDALLQTLPENLTESKDPLNWLQIKEILKKTVQSWERAVEIVDNHRDVDDAESRLQEVIQQLENAIRQAEQILPYHTRANYAKVEFEIREAKEDIQRAVQAMVTAKRLLSEGDDRGAERIAFQTIDYVESARSNIRDIYEVIQRLEQKREEYERRYAELESMRSNYHRRIRSYGHYSNGRLSRGDTLYGDLPRSGRVALDWERQLLAINAVQEAWESGYRRAKRAYEEEQERIRRAEAARRRREAEERRRQEEAARRRREAERRRSSSSSWNSGGGFGGGSSSSWSSGGGFGGGSSSSW